MAAEGRVTQVPAVFGEGRARGVVLVTASAVGQALAAGVAAFATRDIFAALHHGDGGIPVLSLLFLFLAGAAVAGLRVFGRVVAERLGQDYAISVRRSLFRHLTRMPSGAVAKRRTGALALRFVGDLATARNWVALGVTGAISAAIVIPGAAIVLAALNPALAAATAAPLLVAIAIMAAGAPLLGPIHRQFRKRRANLAIDMMERVSTAPELLLMGRDKIELENLERRGRDLRLAAVERAGAAACLRSLPEFGTAAAAAALLWVAFVSGAAPAEAAGALAVLGILVQPMRDLANVWDRRCAWRIAREKLENVLSSPPLEFSNDTQAPRRDGPARVAFKGVWKGELSGFDATLEPGRKVAILGPTGAGKSTCLALAAGLEQAERGAVEFDGVDIRALPLAERQRAVVYIGPRSPILQGSLRRALTLGIAPRPDDAAIEAAARAFGLGGVLDRLGGLEARISAGGHNLSSGEARRVHIVRAALGRPRLLLLDEADGALDAAGREAVRQIVRSTAATTLQVTHDLHLARSAEVLWYIEGGALAAQGAPDDLLRGDGPAARFICPRSVA